MHGRVSTNASTRNSTPPRRIVPTAPTGSTDAGPALRWRPKGDRRGDTAVPLDALQEGRPRADRRCPKAFNLHKTIARQLAGQGADVRDRRRHSTGRPAKRWPSARCCDEGFPVRLSGQDSARGTFSQRHAALVDQETEDALCAAQSCPRRPGRIRSHRLAAVGRSRARLRIWLFNRRTQGAGAVGSAVRRFRQRRAGRHRPVHRVGRNEMAAHVRPGDAAAARL